MNSENRFRVGFRPLLILFFLLGAVVNTEAADSIQSESEVLRSLLRLGLAENLGLQISEVDFM
ncbi:MAG TPA: hypothetical protein VJ974_06450, partial [Geopsychrobacteraceae bacterium]|nr:hypothetical protein [Geopsychrobacteraceae bacterium]